MVVRETVDYLEVLNRQLDRCAELGTRFWQVDHRAPARDRLRAFVGCVWQLYYMTSPVVGRRARLPEGIEEALAKLMAKLEEKGSLAAVWRDVNRVLEEIVRALFVEGLLVRTSSLGVEQ